MVFVQEVVEVEYAFDESREESAYCQPNVFQDHSYRHVYTFTKGQSKSLGTIVDRTVSRRKSLQILVAQKIVADGTYRIHFFVVLVLLSKLLFSC